MPFQEGNPGRPKGSLNKKTILRPYAVMALAGVHPTEELVKIAQSTENEQTRIDLWKYLQSFIEAPQALAKTVSHESPEESVEAAKKMDQQLAELCKPITGANGNHQP